MEGGLGKSGRGWERERKKDAAAGNWDGKSGEVEQEGSGELHQIQNRQRQPGQVGKDTGPWSGVSYAGGVEGGGDRGSYSLGLVWLHALVCIENEGLASLVDGISYRKHQTKRHFGNWAQIDDPKRVFRKVQEDDRVVTTDADLVETDWEIFRGRGRRRWT